MISFTEGPRRADDERFDDETQSLLEELWSTPVGRRWVLKAGLASAAALGVASQRTPAAAQAAARKRTPRVESTDLQFVLGHLPGVSKLTLHANGKRIPLKRHTKTSREALRRRGGVWRAADLSRLSHHVTGVKLPAHRALVVSVYGRRGRHEVLVAQTWHVPRAATIRLAKASHRATGSLRHVVGSSRRLSELGLKPSQVRSPRAVAQLETVIDPPQTALTLTMMHPNIATLNPTAAATTKALLTAKNTPAGSAVSDLGQVIQKMQNDSQDWATSTPARNADNSLATIAIPILKPDPPNPPKVVGHDNTGFSTLQLSGAGPFTTALTMSVTAGITGVRNTASLGAVIDEPLDQDPAASTQTWVQPQGMMAQPRSPGSRKAGAGININVTNPGFLFGTQTEVTGPYNNGHVPLQLYNNYVRWVWVYVQYIGQDNTNLSANPNANWPDTKYSQSLGLLPQVFTVFGFPLVGTNDISVNLNFPEKAHTARLLFCGLGSNLLDGNWRQYFPADAYLDSNGNPMIAPGGPDGEVFFASLVTGILTIGLSAFALVTDINIAAVWKQIKDLIIDDGYAGSYLAFAGLFKTGELVAAEALALGIAGGGETYESIAANHGSAENIWSLLLPLASVIPKIIFGPGTAEFWANVAFFEVEAEGIEAATDAVPFIGEVIGVIQAVGDAITLAEVCAETIIAPWVIENEVSLTYAATVTIDHATNDATFPRSATSYSLTAQIGGSKVLDPINGTVTQGQSAPVVVQVPNAPFGGSQIQWSVVFTNAAGQQVGTGASPQYTNDDPSNPPSAVAITIIEIPVPITATTVFERSDTTGYSSAAGGYTWSSQITDTGTILSKGIQQVTGATVSTLAGVAGVVWEQDNQFYVRGVPVAQNGATISLGAASVEGFARRPFLLLDPFVQRTDEGNHVLLAPDPNTQYYHVRKVSLDPTTGAPTWDPTVSYGTFLLPVSAAALHSSGHVVAIHTDSGRFGWLKPVQTMPRPVVAAYTAGPGTTTGLLNTPIALAVTNAGTVLVLEAGGQLAAFDLNGNPVPYFGTSLTRRALMAPGRRRRGATQGQFTLPLVSSGTYLDVAVDGAAQIYVLYYTGDGVAPSDYRVDVYTQAGAVLDTNSPGVNVPHLAVDYWRNIYAGNFNPLAGIVSGQPRIDPALTVAEPSMSVFIPTNPTKKRKAKSRPPQKRP